VTFPKRDTRSVSVDGNRYLWHLNSDFDVHNRWVVVSQGGASRPLLFIDPYHHDFSFPGTVVLGIRFAIAQGWSTDDGPDAMRLRWDGKDFAVLPPDVSTSRKQMNGQLSPSDWEIIDAQIFAGRRGRAIKMFADFGVADPVNALFQRYESLRRGHPEMFGSPDICVGGKMVIISVPSSPVQYPTRCNRA